MPAAAARREPFALAALVLGAVAIGSSAIWVRLAETGPVATAFWRVLLAVPVLWVWAWSERDGTQPSATRANRKGLIAAGIFFAGDLAFWHISIILTSVAAATLLANLAPIFVTLAGWLWLKERVTSGFVSGLGIALLGVSLLLSADFGSSARALWGDLFGLVTALFYAAYQLQIKQLRAHLSTARIMAATSLVTALAVLPVSLLLGEDVIPATASGWGVVIGLALVSQVGGQSLIAYGLAHLPASLGSVSLLIQPVCATLFAWLLLGEAIGALQIAGGCIALIGIRMAQRASAAG
ncbi:MAG: DMT family transporter [Burkholderiales bacterium]|nr:DMT family transporter [Burkholderiales bacterium]